MVGCGILSGSEGSWTYSQLVGGAGAVAAGVQRVTLASDDPAVIDLAAIEVLLTTIDADTSKITACNTGAVVLASGTVTTVSTVTNLAQLGGQAVSMGTGVRDAGTQRVTIATNDSVAVTGTVAIDQTTPGTTNAVDITDDVTRLLGKIANYDILANGTLTELNSVVSIAAANLGTAGLGISGTWEGTIVAEGDVGDGVWATIPMIHSLTGAAISSTTANGNWFVGLAGFLNVRVRMSLYTSGTATVYLEGTSAPAGVFLNRSIPTGGNTIGAVQITAGNNNIGNVDIVTLPSGNLGMQAMAASVSVVPASDITDGTYIGDIKFGEALPTGANAIGKLAANNGIDIGDVDVTSVVPGIGATNLGKARASALGATDTGVASLVVRNDDLADLAGADGDYTVKQVDNRGALYVNQAAAEPKQASGVAAGGAPGTDDMIAAVASKKLLILALSLFATSTTTNTVYVDNVDNDLLGNSGNGIPLSLDADGDTVPGFVLPFNPGGWFKTDAVNEAVTLNSSAAQDIIWCITWIETD
jgi:hypothetical protein